MSGKRKPTTAKRRTLQNRVVTMTLDAARRAAPGHTDFARLDAMTDADIAQQIADDPDTSPEWTDEMFASASVVMPPKKIPVSIRMDPDVFEYFKGMGEGYLTRMNAVLRSYMEHHRRRSA